MITEHEKFRVPDDSGRNHFFFEVNWKQDDPLINDCKVVKVTFPNKETAHVKKEHLHAILFAIGDRAEQMKMIPQVKRVVKEYETVVEVIAKKDIHKGEKIIFPIKLRLPEPEEHVIASIKNMKKNKSSGIIMPDR